MSLIPSEKQNLIVIEVTKPNPTKEIFPDPPLLSGNHLGWNKVNVLHCRNRHDTPEHYSESNIIVVNLQTYPKNTWNIWLDGKCYEPDQQMGSLGIFPANTIIRSVSKDWVSFVSLLPDSMFFKTIAQEWIDPARGELIPQPFTQSDPFILGTGLALKSELESDALGGNLYYESMSVALAAHLLRQYSTSVPTIKVYQKGLAKNKLKQALEYLQEHLAEGVTLEAIAQELDISQYYFCHLFKRSMGIPPHKYLNQQRIERAKQLLAKEKLSIAEIGERVGFSNQSHFIKLFRRFIGMTPGNYREKSLNRTTNC
ncbi:AraC family transcriptional regulator [Gloeocapsa sp. PCC 73106]|uniref:helix-turn-helix domain-containing protein n=1 Tax=Gloeocapsa sp. PCC 73106 TaxID=102232 RepID=UPI0002ABD02D|nr:AraC family transcriptional regulator [Gloeocapsa sp. PCC 73106]ELR98446.1 DNA-binding domain-containing protein, AraC-type [Gloeocapsa sp. PCC 73106]